MSTELAVMASSPTVTTDPSVSQYNETFGPASDVFEKLMGQYHKSTHFESPKAVLEVLDKTMQQFDDFGVGSQRLNMWLEFYVDLLFTVSAKLWENTQAVSITHNSLLLCYCTLTVSFPSASLTRGNDL